MIIKTLTAVHALILFERSLLKGDILFLVKYLLPSVYRLSKIINARISIKECSHSDRVVLLLMIVDQN